MIRDQWFRSFAGWIGKSDSPFDSGVGLGEGGCCGDEAQQGEARHKHSYGEFQWVPPRRKIYRAEIFVDIGDDRHWTHNGGDSVGDGLHPGFTNCQLDIFKDREYFRRPIEIFASDNYRAGDAVHRELEEVPFDESFFGSVRSCRGWSSSFPTDIEERSNSTEEATTVGSHRGAGDRSGQLIEYKHALSEEIATSVHDEPGVLKLVCGFREGTAQSGENL